MTVSPSRFISQPALEADRRHREGWLAESLAQLSPAEQRLLADALELLERISEG